MSLPFATVILIVIPLFAILSEIYFFVTNSDYPEYLRIIELCLVLVLILYCIKPMILPVKYHSEKRALKNLVAEFEFLKKLIYIGMPLLIIFIVIFAYTSQPGKRDLTYFIFPGLILIVGGTLLRIVSNIARRDFRYDYASACLYLSTTTRDETAITTYLLRALDAYDKFLRRILHHQINDISKLYSKILSESKAEKHETIKSVSAAFESVDKLNPVKYFSSYLSDKDSSRFLVKVPLIEIIKEWAKFLAVLLPVVISIVQYLFPQ
jgi:hypothetical protein